MRIASIDIGTNTILLLVADTHLKEINNIIHDEQVIARIGKGVDAEKFISVETFDRAEGFLTRYKKICDSYSVDKILAVGTSALRDAKNTSTFCDFIRTRTGIDIAIISGDEEAELTYRGGISEFIEKADSFSVIDIGGGSTELIVGNRRNLLSKTSIDIGSVRLTERFLKVSPPPRTAMEEARSYIRSKFQDFPVASIRSTFAIGVAGTLTTLAALDLQLPEYSRDKVSGHVLHLTSIQTIFDSLTRLSVDEIQTIPQISVGRADIITAGVMILLEYMDFAKIDAISVSDRGLRYGVIYKEIGTEFTRTFLR